MIGYIISVTCRHTAYMMCDIYNILYYTIIVNSVNRMVAHTTHIAHTHYEYVMRWLSEYTDNIVYVVSYTWCIYTGCFNNENRIRIIIVGEKVHYQNCQNHFTESLIIKVLSILFIDVYSGWYLSTTLIL